MIILRLLALLIILFIIFKLLFYRFESNLIYRPQKLPENYKFNFNETVNYLQKNYGLNASIEEYLINTSDNCLINAAYLKNPNTKNNILYCHGNSANLSYANSIFNKLGRFSSIMYFDYRGFGKSTCMPSEKGVYTDILTIWNFMINNLKIKPKNITILGYSLGCSPASYLASTFHKSELPHALILHSGFSKMKNMASDYFNPFLVNFVDHNFDNITNLKKTDKSLPVLIAHSETDEVINFYHKNLLMKALEGFNRKEFYKLKGNHSNKLKKNFLYKIIQYLPYKPKDFP